MRTHLPRAVLVDVCFALAVLVWLASLATMFHVGYLIGPFAIPLFVVALLGRCTWRRAFLAALGVGWGAWMLSLALG
ncbi:MAG: hypothetical protein OXN86_06785 [Chloroflexota bacterium]|nr:hypothetical protein [Chloroflexota bacterium]